MNIADIGVTKPAAGVIATSPATAPEIAPIAVGLPLLIQSITIHASIALAAAKCVVTNALVASELAARALPALNPNHPNQSRPAPIRLSTELCGVVGSLL